MDVFDEDAAAKSAERAQQLEEVADLEQEIARTRQKAQAMTNQLLKTRELRKLAGLEEDLKAKKVIFGLEDE
jgi:transcription initiation factor TFIID subunit 7